MGNETATSDVAQFPLRPTGHDVSEYRDYQHWSVERWAWEFLRRNSKYQQWCCQVETENWPKKRRNEFAITQFGLMSYKHFREPFQADGVKRPKFTTRNIQTWSRVSKDQLDKFRDRSISPPRPGEVLIKFNVSAVKQSRKAIERQIRAAQTYLNKLAGIWVRQNQIDDETRRFRANGLIELLRLLDIIEYNDNFSPPESKKSRSDLYGVVFPRLARTETHGKGDHARFQQAFQDRMEVAKRYADTYYLEVAATDRKIPAVRLIELQ